MANGATRTVLSQNVIRNESQSALNKDFENENEAAKIEKIPLKYPSPSNFSK